MSDRLPDLLAAGLGGQWQVEPLHASGFCATSRARRGRQALFVKSLPAAGAEVLAAEADGLAALAATGTVRVPAVHGHGSDAAQDLAWLALEWLDFHPSGRDPGARFGHAIGGLHRSPTGDRFGWQRDNRLGATPQRNAWSRHDGLAGWLEFFGQQRLGAMREQLARAGRLPESLDDALRRVVEAMPSLFDDGHVPRPSLIHGDLWSGNWGMLADGSPVVFDPAVSCSDAEAELAMMELFGAPSAAFWPAYRETAGLHPGYARRRPLYQLYHLLNHALLFGGGYPQQALAMARALA